MNPYETKNNFRVLLSSDVLKTFMAYIMAVNYEISGLGEVEVVKHIDGVDFVIKKLHLIKQASTGTSTVLDAFSIAQLMGKLLSEKKDLSTLKLWWHSHGTLAVFWSGTDINTINEFDDGKKDWMLSIVGNRRQEMLARLDIYHPFRMTFDKIQIVVVPDDDWYFQSQINEEVREKVTYREPVQIPPVSYGVDGLQFLPRADDFWNNFPDQGGENYGR